MIAGTSWKPRTEKDLQSSYLSLDAVYVDAKAEKRIIAVKPKPPLYPVFHVAAAKESSGVIHTVKRASRGLPGGSCVFLVETGESRTPRPEELAQDLLQA